ncbi:hypothetical protein QQY66_35540 [Streptomyces sp. DG2A-72]|nr:hypothetical protein [Streptomyces sp. DG2A-72]MDO0936770.1 hypothetical protein [Streptomyces sp. DG2A-72]
MPKSVSIDVEIVERNPKDKGFAPKPKQWVAEICQARRIQVVVATP